MIHKCSKLCEYTQILIKSKTGHQYTKQWNCMLSSMGNIKTLQNTYNYNIMYPYGNLLLIQSDWNAAARLFLSCPWRSWGYTRQYHLGFNWYSLATITKMSVSYFRNTSFKESVLIMSLHRHVICRYLITVHQHLYLWCTLDLLAVTIK